MTEREAKRLQLAEWHAAASLDRARKFLDRAHTWANEVDLNRAEQRYADAAAARRFAS